ncbi:MAG: GAF domain-containing protein [Bacillaceae bacterium]
MFAKTAYTKSKEENYITVINQLKHLIMNEKNTIANLANASALLNQFLEDVNWVGFYLTEDDNTLVLGPFQGLPACIRIPFSKGVCGAAATTKTTQRVADVHTFPGHIACDGATNSEIVIPMIVDEKVIGVLDIDSPSKNRFDEIDEKYLTLFVEQLLANH